MGKAKTKARPLWVQEKTKEERDNEKQANVLTEVVTLLGKFNRVQQDRILRSARTFLNC